MTSLRRTPVTTFDCLEGGGVHHKFSASREGDKRTLTLDGEDKEVTSFDTSRLTAELMAKGRYFPDH